MTNEEREYFDERFDNILSEMDTRFSEMEAHFNKRIDSVMSVIVEGFKRQGKRFDALEQKNEIIA